MPSSEPLDGAAVRAVGDRACLVELPDLGNVLRVAERIRRLAGSGALDGIVEVVPAARTVLIVCAAREALRRAIGMLQEIVSDAVDGDPLFELGPVDGAPEIGADSATIVIDAVYDGVDLDAVAEYTGLSREAVVAAHTGTDWRAAFGGFAPGFVYLSGGDPRLRVPRLDSPRRSVPAGSVAIAGEFSAVYPGASPGGWRLLGRTDARVWDPAGERPSLISPGSSVRFRSVHGRAEARREAESPAPRAASQSVDPPALTVLDPGLLSLVQDAGRPGFAAVGVTASGAMDRGALARANLAAGNPPAAAAIETLAGGLSLRAERELLAAIAGADATVRPAREAAPSPSEGPAETAPVRHVAGSAVRLHPGDTLRVEAPAAGLRSYVAFAGGLAVEAVLGSRSADQLSGLGPAPLRAGDGLRVGAASEPDPAPSSGSEAPSLSSAPVSLRSEPVSLRSAPVSLRFVPGPRDDWFEPVALTALAGAEWTLKSESNRVGARLDGPPLPRALHGELLSEGTVAGSIQVPPDGLPVLFLADHPVTGGYPVIGTVLSADLDLAGQLAPGDAVRFEPVDADGIPLRRSPMAPGQAQAGPLTAFSIEIDGRRRAIRIPPDLAAIIAGLLESPDDAPLREAIAALVASIDASDAAVRAGGAAVRGRDGAAAPHGPAGRIEGSAAATAADRDGTRH